MKRPKLLLLFCNAGGGSVGYARAGFDVTGVDILPQPNNPAYWNDAMKAKHGVAEATFEFIQGDALQVLASIDLDPFDAIHASPPCQAYSWSAKRWTNIPRADLLDPTRQMLIKTGLPYVIENVIGAPMPGAVVLCGLSFDITGAGLHNGEHPEVIRHRQFETNWHLPQPKHVRHIPGGVTKGIYVTVAGHGGDNAKGRGGRAHKQRAMGIDWMTDHELNESIPPKYLQYVGDHLHALIGTHRRCFDLLEFELSRGGASRQWNLAEIDEQEFAEGRAYLNADGTCGFLVTKDGELANLFNHGARGAGRHAVKLALACGANRVNCYDGWLADYYRSLGFAEYDRIEFDPSLAPRDWPASEGRPDVVFMRRVERELRKPSVLHGEAEVARG